MKARLFLGCLGACLAQMVVGTAYASPVYEFGDTGSAVNAADLSPQTLWWLMTNEGADDGAWEASLRAAASGATVITYTDLPAYNAAVGAHDVITFTEPVVTPGDILVGQYTVDGATFLDGNDLVLANTMFVSDGVGAHGGGSLTIEFSTPQWHLGLEFPGNLRISLYSGAVDPGNLVWASSGVGDFGAIASTGNFAGLESDVSFDHVVLSDPVDGFAFIDNLHYLIPEPSTAMLLGLGLLGVIRRGRFNGGSR